MRCTRGRFVVLVGVCLLTVSGLAGVASAEEVDPAGKRDVTEQDLLGLKVQVASLEATSLLAAPSMVSVIDAATLRELNVTSVAEALELVAGFAVTRTYLKRDLPTGRGVLQENYANKVLLLINNVPTWMAVTGEGALARVDIHDVARIEVLKGPASVVYGTNAYVGAINIVLKDPSEYRSELQLGVASEWGFTSGGNALITVGDLSLLAAGNSSSAPAGKEPFTDESGVKGQVDEFMTSRNATVQGRYGGHAVLANGYDASESFLGTSPTYALGAGKDHLLRGCLLNYTYTGMVGGFGLVAGATYDWNQRDFSRTGDNSQRALVEGYRIQGTGRAVRELLPGLNLQVGAEWEDRVSKRYENYTVRTDTIVAKNNMADRSVTESSLYAQLNWSKNRLHLVVGSRYTNNELFGGNVSSRATGVYELTSASSLKLMAGRSYRVPSLFELYFQTPTNTVYGNTDLEPETSDAYELAYVAQHGNLFVQALGYHATYDNKIVRVRRYPKYSSDPKDTSTIYVNGNRFSANGLELEARYRLPHNLSALMSYTFVDGDEGDKEPGTDNYNFKYVPVHTLAVGLTKYFGPLWTAAVVHYTSEVGGPLADIGSETSYDLTVGYGHKVSGLMIRHLLSAKNAGNEDGRDPEYVRRIMNDIPNGYRRRISYTLQVGF
jgi:outer membrane receptor for ferrienterochelin and colicin